MDTADAFLSTGKKFQLGFLETEKTHPFTSHLSSLVQKNVAQAVEALVQVDVDALEKLKAHTGLMLALRAAITATRQQGGRIFFCGCGATGRLSLTLEVLYREAFKGRDDVVAFMAGGDVALVHSLEGFEDFPEYGERHLLELGYTDKDLLVAITEGGETPYVIGAVEAAAKIVGHGPRQPFFMYCNPDNLLIKIDRSRSVIENPHIRKMNLTVGPMALAGSTRMQASTVLQLAAGLALLTDYNTVEIENYLSDLQQYLRENAPTLLPPFIAREAAEYREGRYVLYRVRDYAITVFTDTTERAPTFSLTPFSHRKAERLLKLKPSLSYVSLTAAKTPEAAWRALLARDPRPLNWEDKDPRTNAEYLREFDFSINARDFRGWLTSNAEHTDFEIFRFEDSLIWSFQDQEVAVLGPELAPGASQLFEHTLLKMFLNMHSTLIMGLLGRYKSNLMTWVYPTNGKLIDRASRYAQTLLREEGFDVPYEEVVHELFAQKQKISANQSIVLAVYESLLAKKSHF